MREGIDTLVEMDTERVIMVGIYFFFLSDTGTRGVRGVNFTRADDMFSDDA